MSLVLIAIVDDEEPVRDATKRLVRSMGYHASTFASADEFLKSEQIQDTSCLITDVRLGALANQCRSAPAFARPRSLHPHYFHDWLS
jgi:FixJ family two-component response regulator